MRKRKIYSLICIAVATVLLLASCSSGTENELATIQFSIKEQATRTLGPEHGTLVTTQYRFTFENGPEDLTRTLDANTLGSYRIKGIKPGAYRVTVEALNSDGTVLATAVKNYRFLPGLSNYSVTLEALDGTGELKVTFTWDPALFTDNEGQAITPNAVFTLEDQTGSVITVASTEITFNAKEGSYLIHKTNLPSGSYLLSFTLMNGEEIVTGAVDVARVTDSIKTEGTIHLSMNKTIVVSGFGVVDNTAAPIVATIQTDKTFNNGEPASIVTFSLDYTYLPEGITAEDVTVDWYNEEYRFAKGKASVSFTPNAGTTRITAIYKCAKIGSMGATSIDFYFPGM